MRRFYGAKLIHLERERIESAARSPEGWCGRTVAWNNQETKWQPKRKAPSAVRRDQTGRR